MTLLKKLTLGTAMTALALAGATGAQAQTMDNGMMMDPTMTTPSMMPTLVSGTVQTYYVDRAGYVSAMDVATADGVRMVRFAPAMAQRVTALYPVGSTASVYVTSRMMGNMTSYDLAGMGPEMPAPTSMMMPMNLDAVDVLKATPYIQIGAKSQEFRGNVTGYISDPANGEVLGIVLDNKTLVRVPMQNRLVQASTSPTGITPLFKNAFVVAQGYKEAPLYGVVSPFETRVAATGISVNGETLGPLGFGKIMSGRKPLFGFDIKFLGGGSPDDLSMQSNSMGYMPYNMTMNTDQSAMTNEGAMQNSGINTSPMNNGM